MTALSKNYTHTNIHTNSQEKSLEGYRLEASKCFSLKGQRVNTSGFVNNVWSPSHIPLFSFLNSPLNMNSLCTKLATDQGHSLSTLGQRRKKSK